MKMQFFLEEPHKVETMHKVSSITLIDLLTCSVQSIRIALANSLKFTKLMKLDNKKEKIKCIA